MARPTVTGRERDWMRGVAHMALLGVLLAGCRPDRMPTAPEPPESCAPPQTPVAAVSVAHLGAGALEAAVLDARQRLSAALPAGSATDELRAALGQLAQNLGAANREAGCRAWHTAHHALERQANEPATLPDRTALRLVLDLTAATLR